MTILKTFNDIPEANCQLGRANLINAIVQQIENVEPPKAIAINGTWGTGKTSVMMQTYNRLGGKKFDVNNAFKTNIKPVWFEAWQFQNEPNILAALLREIRDQLSWYFKFEDEFKKFTDGAFHSVWNSINFTFKEAGTELGFKTSDFEKGKEKYEKDNFSQPLQSITLKKALEDAIDKLVHGQNFLEMSTDAKYKAVIFIDDLDRCEPEVAFKILEVIKLYMNLRNCIFVLGVDMEALERIIAKYYEKILSDKADLKHLSRLYLEKICQDAYHILPLSNSEKSTYFSSLLAKVKAGNTDTNKIDVIYKISALQQKYDFLPPFPRSIKLFTNVLITHLNHLGALTLNSPAQERNKLLEKLVVLCYLNAFHFELFQLVHLYSKDKFYDEFLLAYCKNPNNFIHKSEEGKEGTIKKSKHPILDGIILPYPQLDENINLDSTTTNKDINYPRQYPHTSLRQVLWIRKLILETSNLLDSEIQMLRIK
jgi:KAP family P-loop domain